jgi:hypothetical protein
MKQQSFSTGDQIVLMGHTFRVTKAFLHVYSDVYGKRLHLSCAPQCCTNPLNIEVDIVEQHLNEIIKMGNGYVLPK